MKIFIVIPLYNEKRYFSILLRDLKPFKFSVVVVDDGSTDSGNKNFGSNVAYLRHEINLGKGAAMKTGAEYAFTQGAEAVIFMDADGQHDPTNLKVFENKLNSKKYDVIFGARNLNKGVPFVRMFGNRLASFVIKFLFGIYVSDPLCGYRALTKKAFEDINWESAGYGVESEILAKTGKKRLKFIEISVKTIFHDKHKGVSVLDAFGVLGDILKWKLTK